MTNNIKQKINNEIVSMRHLVRQVKVHVINKLTKTIKQLRNKKGTEEQKLKNSQKADRYVEEISLIKKLNIDNVTKYGLTMEKSSNEILADINATSEDRALARLCSHKILAPSVSKIKDKYAEVIEQFVKPVEKSKSKSKRKKSKPEKLQISNQCIENIKDHVSKTKIDLKNKEDIESDVSKIKTDLKSKKDIEGNLSKTKIDLKNKEDIENDVSKIKTDLKSKKDIEGNFSKTKIDLKSKEDIKSDASKIKTDLKNKKDIKGNLSKTKIDVKNKEDIESDVSEIKTDLKSKKDMEGNFSKTKIYLKNKDIKSDASKIKTDLKNKKDIEGNLSKTKIDMKNKEDIENGNLKTKTDLKNKENIESDDLETKMDLKIKKNIDRCANRKKSMNTKYVNIIQNEEKHESGFTKDERIKQKKRKRKLSENIDENEINELKIESNITKPIKEIKISDSVKNFDKAKHNLTEFNENINVDKKIQNSVNENTRNSIAVKSKINLNELKNVETLDSVLKVEQKLYSSNKKENSVKCDESVDTFFLSGNDDSDFLHVTVKNQSDSKIEHVEKKRHNNQLGLNRKQRRSRMFNQTNVFTNSRKSFYTNSNNRNFSKNDSNEFPYSNVNKFHKQEFKNISNANEEDQLHPSWQAKKMLKPQIIEFQGKKITFDD